MGRQRDLMNVRLPFGKHKGRKIREVPAQYVHWLSTEFRALDEFPDLKQAVKQYCNELESEGHTMSLEAMADNILRGNISSRQAEAMLNGTAEVESVSQYLR